MFIFIQINSMTDMNGSYHIYIWWIFYTFDHHILLFRLLLVFQQNNGNFWNSLRIRLFLLFNHYPAFTHVVRIWNILWQGVKEMEHRKTEICAGQTNDVQWNYDWITIQFSSVAFKFGSYNCYCVLMVIKHICFILASSGPEAVPIIYQTCFIKLIISCKYFISKYILVKTMLIHAYLSYELTKNVCKVCCK